MANELREALAEYAHEAWSGWMQYMFKKSDLHKDNGTAIVPKDLVMRWWRQADAPYADLSEKEKESDRKEADRILEILQEHDASSP